MGAAMGVINEYFLARSDAAAADIIDTGPACGGVAGSDPGGELASLEAILLDPDTESEEALARVTREDHAVDIGTTTTRAWLSK